jgi:glutamate synthase (NADPH/NADH) small chain
MDVNKRPEMPNRSPEERVKDFESVALGLTLEQAVIEAKRCLQCKNPLCVKGCPVEIDIPAFIKYIAEGNFDAAIKKIKEKNNLPAVCGRVCPQEDQCEKVCILAKRLDSIAIGALERFAADWEMSRLADEHRQPKTANRDKVAVVGSGPAGLTCAADLAKTGYQVTLFESLHLPGGVLTYGIPEFRLPKKTVEWEIEYIKKLGVELKTNMLIGKTLSIEDLLRQGYKAIFIGTGAGLPQFLGIPGENLNRVYSANEFLTRVNLMKAYLFPLYDTPLNIGRKVAVIGGGNVAMDCARVAMRLGAEKVYIVYRRTGKEMPARIEEIANGEDEGIIFRFLTLPLRILPDSQNFVRAMECIKMKLAEPDKSGRPRPVPIENSEFILDVDTVIVAIGQRPNPLLIQATTGLKTGEIGNIVVDAQTTETSLKGVFAGGDITTGADTVISAMGAGKRAARAIDSYLSSH